LYGRDFRSRRDGTVVFRQCASLSPPFLQNFYNSATTSKVTPLSIDIESIKEIYGVSTDGF